MSLSLASSDTRNYFFPKPAYTSPVEYRGGEARTFAVAWKLLVSTAQAIIVDTVNEPRADQYEARFGTLERLRLTPSNWSSESVETPSDAQADAAKNALKALMIIGAPVPDIMLLNDGTFGAFWKKSGAYASIDFDSDGVFPWSASKDGDVISGIWSGGALPAQLREAIGG
jgi:hypothetical protein